MTDPHLLPDQIDLLVDGDAGSSTRPLRAHLEACADCRARFDQAQRAADAIEAMPHFTPRLPFADHVMAKVQVVEPWHVALAEDARRVIPDRGPVRSVAAAGAILTGLLLAAIALWAALRWDVATWMFSLGAERIRVAVGAGARMLVSEAFGVHAAEALARGDVGPIAIAATVLVAVSVGAALTFRRLAAAARAKRG